MLPGGWDKPLETATGREVILIISLLMGAWVVIVGAIWIVTILTKRRMRKK